MDIVFGASIVVLVALLIGVAALRRRRETLALVARDVLSARERECHRLLMMQYPGHHIFAQYALSQLLDVQAGASNPQSVRNQFSRLVADFVLCRADYSVVAVVELDDSTHGGLQARERDARKDLAIRSAGLRLVSIPAGPLPAGPDLRRLIDGEAVATGGAHALGAGRSSSVLLAAAALVLLVIGGAALYRGWRVTPLPLPTPAKAGRSAPGERAGAAPSVKPPTVTPPAPPRPALESATATAREPALVASETPSSANVTPSAQEPDPSPDKKVLDAKNKKKELAWAAYYKPYPSCEHPASWEDQVECGNRYIRARREFDKQWDASQGRSR